MRLVNATLVTPGEILPDAGVEIREERIVRILAPGECGDINLEGAYLLPGLLDLHTHPAPEDRSHSANLDGLCRELRAEGTAAFLFALANIALPEMLDAARALSKHLAAMPPGAACLGIYLEGPYIESAGRGGFQPAAIASPQAFPLDPLLEACGPWTRYINISPGLPGAAEAIAACRASGIAVSIGHTAATREELHAALEAGANTVCHTFNASALQRWKEPGVLDITVDLLGLASEQLVCELICDGVHVDPLLVKLLYKAKGVGHIALVTDSVLGGRAAQEGREIAAGTTTYRVENGVGRLPDGGLAGSTLTMARAVKNFVSYTGCSLPEAAEAAALTPARVLGLDHEYGAIRPGCRALFCVLDERLEVRTDLCRRVNAVE